MPNKIPLFKSEEEEADFWDKHSPLDFIPKPQLEVVKVKALKCRILCIRLDSESRSKLEMLASQHHVGPSTFARLIVMSVISMRDKGSMRHA